MTTSAFTPPPAGVHARHDPISAPDASTFGPGLRLLHADVRTDVYRLYHVLRALDDLVDEDQPQAEGRVAAVELWAHGGHADSPEVGVLNELSLRHTLPAKALLEFCQGMRHDMTRTVIDTEDDLERYCQRAGGAVGILLAHLLGTTRSDGAAKMAMLGRAAQRTNILRDIDEDAAHGRVYIARETIARFGAPVPGAREQLMRDQIVRADSLYEQAAEATSLLARGRSGMSLCATLYRGILRQIERDGYGARAGQVDP